VKTAAEVGQAPPPAMALRAARRQPGLVLGFAILVLLVASAVLAPVVTPVGRDAVRLEERNRPPAWHHPLGTDDLGRDTLTRLAYGGRVSLAVAALSTLVAVGLGATLGLVAGYRGGRIDALVQHTVDVALSLPTFFVVLLLGAWFGAQFATLCLVIGLTTWMPSTRLVRTAAQSLRERPFVDAARALGSGTPRILRRHLLPGVAAPVLVTAALSASQAVLLEAALGFLGFGLQPPTPSWGTMLQEAQAHLFDAPWRAVVPGVPLVATALALHLVADGVRDRLDPHLRAALR
jgi:peptide/nickel transport system permease protein